MKVATNARSSLCHLPRIHHSQNETEALRSRSGGSTYLFSSSPQTRASNLQNLIANPRLEFAPTYRKPSSLRIPNRERTRVLRARWRLAIFRAPWCTTITPLDSRIPKPPLRALHPSPITYHRPSATHHCGSNRRPRRLALPLTHANPMPYEFLIGVQTHPLRLAFRCHSSHTSVTAHAAREQAFSIHGIIGFLCSP